MSISCARSHSATSRSFISRASTKRSKAPRSRSAHRIPVVLTVGHADDLEPSAVVPFEQLRRQIGGRVLVKVGRKVRHPDPVVPTGCSCPCCSRRLDPLCLGESARAVQLLPRAKPDIPEEVERQCRRVAGTQRRADLLDALLEVGPIRSTAAGSEVDLLRHTDASAKAREHASGRGRLPRAFPASEGRTHDCLTRMRALDPMSIARS